MANSHHLVARSARRADVPELAMVLTRAFTGDPFFSWLLPDPDARRTVQPRFFRSMLYRHVLYAHATDVVTLRTAGHEPHIVGGAVWAAPHGYVPIGEAPTSQAPTGQAPTSRALTRPVASRPLIGNATVRLQRLAADLRYGLDGLSIARGRLRQIVAGLRQLSRLHPQEPHWYLDTIGTDPLAGHIGAGRALLEYRLAFADRDHLPVYLEASTEGVVPFYRRFGFLPRQTVTLPGGPTLWTMLRSPR